MGPDDQELTCHLFAKATELLEQAHALSVEGQAADGDPSGVRTLADRLVTIADNVSVIARAVAVAASSNPTESSGRQSDL